MDCYYDFTYDPFIAIEKQIKESFSYVWNHAKEKTMLGKNSPNNPIYMN